MKNTIKHKLPPLNALRAFEASSYHLSFTKAAKELCVSQGAISKQISHLEEYLGFSLFKRIHHGLILTKKAEEYYANITSALNAIRISTYDISHNVNHENILNIDVPPSFSSHFIIPNLESFKNQYPNINLRIITGYGIDIDFSKSNIDIAIRFHYHELKNLENRKLMDEDMILVCSPAIAKKIKKLSDITNYTFLDNDARPHVAKEWMESVGLNIKNIKNRLSFEHFFMIIAAAKQGLGLALVPEFLVKNLLKENKLANPFNITYKNNFSYYLIYPKHKKILPKVVNFIDWIEKLIDKNNRISSRYGKCV